MQLTEFNYIENQQHHKVSRYIGFFIGKKTRSSFQHFHEWSTLLQVDYVQTTQQAQPIYIPPYLSLHEHTPWICSLQKNTCYSSSYLSYLALNIKIWHWQHSKWHQSHNRQTSLLYESLERPYIFYACKTDLYRFQYRQAIITTHIYFIQSINL